MKKVLNQSSKLGLVAFTLTCVFAINVVPQDGFSKKKISISGTKDVVIRSRMSANPDVSFGNLKSDNQVTFQIDSDLVDFTSFLRDHSDLSVSYSPRVLPIFLGSNVTDLERLVHSFVEINPDFFSEIVVHATTIDGITVDAITKYLDPRTTDLIMSFKDELNSGREFEIDELAYAPTVVAFAYTLILVTSFCPVLAGEFEEIDDSEFDMSQ